MPVVLLNPPNTCEGPRSLAGGRSGSLVAVLPAEATGLRQSTLTCWCWQSGRPMGVTWMLLTMDSDLQLLARLGWRGSSVVGNPGGVDLSMHGSHRSPGLLRCHCLEPLQERQ